MGNTVKTPRASEETNMPSQTGQESDFLAVLYDYPSADISQPIFHVGEKLRVLSDEGGWWRVHSLTTGRENYIPGKYVAKVYHGWLFEGLGREKAEELLQLPNTKVGSFMIRESETRKGFYSLSVRHRQVKHYRIFRLPNNWYYISPRQTFQCLEDLVNHYSEVADGLCCVLTTPCLTQCTNNNSVTNQVPPVVMRHKNFSWRNIHRLEVSEDTESTLASVDDSCLSYGLRESIASYLSLTGDDTASFASARKKKAQSLIYTGSKRGGRSSPPDTHQGMPEEDTYHTFPPQLPARDGRNPSPLMDQSIDPLFCIKIALVNKEINQNMKSNTTLTLLNYLKQDYKH